MVDYVSRMPGEEGAAGRPQAPALLLVHGFGAFGEQWRGQLAPLAAAGYQVRRPSSARGLCRKHHAGVRVYSAGPPCKAQQTFMQSWPAHICVVHHRPVV